MDEATAERVIDRILQLHRAEEYELPYGELGAGISVAVCAHCRREDGGRVGMPCPTALLTRTARQVNP